MSSSTAPRTIRTYRGVLNFLVPKKSGQFGVNCAASGLRGYVYIFFRRAVVAVPPDTGQPLVRWNYVQLVKATVAFRRVARGYRPIFDHELPPQMGVFWHGRERACVHTSNEKSPSLLRESRRSAGRGPRACPDFAQQ